MNIEGLLEYAKIDEELDALNRRYNEESAVAEYKNQTKRRSAALDALAKLNADAGELIAKVDSLAERLSAAKAQLDETASNFEHIEDENEAEYYSKKLEDLLATMTQMTQDVANCEKQLAEVRAQYKKVVVAGADAGKRIKAIGEEYKAVTDQYRPLVGEVRARLDKASVGLGDALQRYLSLKKSNVKRPLVPINGNTCGGCFMEVDVGNMSKLRQEGFVICQNCGRIIYDK